MARTKLVWVLVFWLVTMDLIVILHVPHGGSHIPDTDGGPLQLYSYFTTTPPLPNGDITDSGAGHGTNNQEWKDVYVRTVSTIREDCSSER
jgi:hypothetical protein